MGHLNCNGPFYNGYCLLSDLLQPMNSRDAACDLVLIQISLLSGANPGFLLGGVAPLRNGVADW